MALAKADGEAVLDAAPSARAPSELRGTALRMFRALWWAVFAAIVAAAIWSPFYVADGLNGRYRLYAELGVQWNNPTNSLWPVSEEAARAGLVPRSPVVAINGERLRPNQDRPEEYISRVLDAPGDSVQLRVRLPGGGERAVKLKRLSDREGKRGFLPWLGTDIFFWIALGFAIESLVALTAAFLLFRRRPNEPVVAWLSLGLLLFQINIGLASFLAPAVLGATGHRIASALAVTLLAMGLTMFPEPSLAPRWSRGTRAAIALLGIASAGLEIAGIRDVPELSVGAVQLLLVAPVLIVRYRRLPTGTLRQQIRWAFLGFALFVPMTVAGGVIAILSTAIDPSSPLALPYWTFNIGAFLAVVSPTLAWIGLLVSLLRYRLYDADVAISRSVSFGALALLFVALFAGTEKVIELLGEEYLGENLGVLAGGIGAALAALMIVPMHHRLTHWAERKFQKQLIQLRHGLPALVGDMRETAPAERIAAAALDWVSRGVRASRAALVMGDAVVQARGIGPREIKKWRKGWTPVMHPGLDCSRGDAVFPMRIPLEADGHGRVGWLLLGPRPDGSFYGKDERETLAEIADPLARALEIAAEREAREAAERARWQGQESLNAELMRVLGSLDRKLEQLVSAGPQAAAAE